MLGWLFGGNDHALAATYAGRESATARAQRKAAAQSARRQARHQRTGATRAGQAWDDADRMRERYGRRHRR